MQFSKNRRTLAIYLALGGALIGIAFVVIPLVFGTRIEVSPFLLFAIILICNIAHSLVPEPALKTAQTPVRMFCARLAASTVLAVSLVAVYRIARGIAA
jgi:hypothetical protein